MLENMLLHTESNMLLDENQNTVSLYGVNCSSLEWSIRRAGRLEASVKEATDAWHAKIIRLPLSQDRWFGESTEQKSFGMTAEEYRARVSGIVEFCRLRRVYVILDLHRSGVGKMGTGELAEAGMPDVNSLPFWESVANEYANRDNVLFGLFNEVHDTNAETLFNGGTYAFGGYEYESVGMNALLSCVRAAGANNVCVIGGIDWAFDLRPWETTLAPKDTIGNGILLDTHIYPWKNTDWTRAVLGAAKKYPVIIGELGHYGDGKKIHEGKVNLDCGEYFKRIFSFINDNGFGAIAWDFHDSAGPCLVRSLQGFEPTEHFGVLFKKFLEEKALQASQ